MSNVIPFKFKGRGDARSDAGRSMSAQPNEDGSIRFVVNKRGDTDMHVTGVFERRLQFAVYTAIKGAARMCDAIVNSGGAGHFSAGPIHEQLQQGSSPQSRAPRRLREWTGFGDL